MKYRCNCGKNMKKDAKGIGFVKFVCVCGWMVVINTVNIRYGKDFSYYKEGGIK